MWTISIWIVFGIINLLLFTFSSVGCSQSVVSDDINRDAQMQDQALYNYEDDDATEITIRAKRGPWVSRRLEKQKKESCPCAWYPC